MRFTKRQYENAVEALNEGMTQLEPDGQNCHICGDGGHQAFECGHNPLVAMAICESIARDAHTRHEQLHGEHKTDYKNEFHNMLHFLAGFDSHMGETVGPARCHLPFESDETESAALRGIQ